MELPGWLVEILRGQGLLGGVVGNLIAGCIIGPVSFFIGYLIGRPSKVVVDSTTYAGDRGRIWTFSSERTVYDLLNVIWRSTLREARVPRNTYRCVWVLQERGSDRMLDFIGDAFDERTLVEAGVAPKVSLWRVRRPTPKFDVVSYLDALITQYMGNSDDAAELKRLAHRAVRAAEAEQEVAADLNEKVREFVAERLASRPEGDGVPPVDELHELVNAARTESEAIADFCDAVTARIGTALEPTRAGTLIRVARRLRRRDPVLPSDRIHSATTSSDAELARVQAAPS